MKIIICDDEPAFVELISEYCMRFKEEEEIPMRILRFFSGRDVLEYCEMDRDIDLFILDIKMEDIDGLCLTKKLRGMGMRSKIVFLTSALAFAPKGYEMGVSRYWMKPLEYGRFCSEMKALCASAGVESTKCFPHNLRHLFALSYYRLEKDVVRLADILGHASIETTRIYTSTTDTECRRSLERLSLLA